MPQAPVPQKPLPQPGASHAGSLRLLLAPAWMKPADISFSTGAAGSVAPGEIPARWQSSPQLESLSAMLCRTSIRRPLASQRYSYVGTSLSAAARWTLQGRSHPKYSRLIG
jgi:hypothetical protein